MIYYSIPYDSSKNIGKYYNSFMNLLPNDDDFACFIDGDAMFTTVTFGKQLEDIVNKYTDAGVFVGVTNRVGCSWQVVNNVNKDTNDIEYHRQVGKILQEEKYDLCEIVTYKDKDVFSGVLFLIKKSTWKTISGFKEEGMLTIDNDIHYKCRRHNIPIYKMEGVYVYHWYRNNDRKNIHHLI